MMLFGREIRDDDQDEPNNKEPEPSQFPILAIDPSCQPESKQTADQTNDDKVCHPYLAGRHVTFGEAMRQRTKLSGRRERFHTVRSKPSTLYDLSLFPSPDAKASRLAYRSRSRCGARTRDLLRAQRLRGSKLPLPGNLRASFCVNTKSQCGKIPPCPYVPQLAFFFTLSSSSLF